MRIVIDAQPLLEPLAGIGRYAKSLLDAFSSLELEDDFSLFYGASLRPRRVKLPEFSNPRLKPELIRFPGKVFRLLTEKLRVLPDSALTGACGLYHGLNYYVPRGGFRKIVNIYDMSFMLFPGHFTKERLRDIGRKARVSGGRADAVITGSRSAKQDIVDLLKLPEEKVRVVYNGVGKHFRPLGEEEKNEYRIRKRLPEKFILYVGTIEPRKNLINLARAYHRLDPKGVSLVLAGGKGWLSDGLFEEIRKLNLGDRVLLTGYVPEEELPALYSSALCFAYPSIYEGFGFPPLEAMACGTPVVAGDRSSLPEVIGDGGLCVDPGDPEKLADAICSFLHDEKLRGVMAGKGVRRAARFTWEKCASETYGIYRELAG